MDQISRHVFPTCSDSIDNCPIEGHGLDIEDCSIISAASMVFDDVGEGGRSQDGSGTNRRFTYAQ